MLKSRVLKSFLAVFFLAYVLLVLKLTVFRSGANIQILILIPFVSLINIYKNIGLVYFSYMFFGNIGWFMPFGFLLPLIVPNINLKKIILLTFLFSFFIEVFQYVLMVGYTEIDDVILNTLGGVLGYFCLVKRKVFL